MTPGPRLWVLSGSIIPCGNLKPEREARFPNPHLMLRSRGRPNDRVACVHSSQGLLDTGLGVGVGVGAGAAGGGGGCRVLGLEENPYNSAPVSARDIAKPFQEPSTPGNRWVGCGEEEEEEAVGWGGGVGRGAKNGEIFGPQESRYAPTRFCLHSSQGLLDTGF